MAVADVAVELGPRNRRRLTKGAIGLAVIAAIVAAVLLTRPPNHSGPGGSGNSSKSSSALQGQGIGAQNLGIPYGSSSQLLLRKLGQPTQKQGSCWIYRAPDHVINGLYTGSRVDAMRYCFSAGPTGTPVVTGYGAHTLGITVHGKKYPAAWLAVTIGCRATC